MSLLKLEPSRLFVVPGNHDVNRKIEAAAWDEVGSLLLRREDVTRHIGKWAAGAGAPGDVEKKLLKRVLSRQVGFWTWLDEWGRGELLPADDNHPKLSCELAPARTPFSDSGHRT